MRRIDWNGSCRNSPWVFRQKWHELADKRTTVNNWDNLPVFISMFAFAVISAEANNIDSSKVPPRPGSWDQLKTSEPAARNPFSKATSSSAASQEPCRDVAFGGPVRPNVVTFFYIRMYKLLQIIEFTLLGSTDLLIELHRCFQNSF